MEIIINGFWNRVKELLKEQNKTQIELCEFCGLNLHAFRNKIALGTNPNVIDAYKIAKYLNTSVEYLVTGKETNEYKKMYEELLEEIWIILEAAKEGRLDELIAERNISKMS